MNKIHLSAIIPETLSGKRLDYALAQLFPDYSRTMLQQWIKNKGVSIDGSPVVSTKYAVKQEQSIEINTTIEEQGDWSPQAISLNIIYEDAHILVINKPVGLVVHPGAGNPDQTLVNALLHYSSEQSLLPRAGIVHRLDKDTSGLLIIARTLPAHQALIKMMQAREIHREYRALVLGNVISGGTIDLPIGRNTNQRTKMTVLESGKEAVTHYRIIARYPKHTLLSVTLETGRTHQIRVHLAHIGYPIVGDRVYGKIGRENKSQSLSHQALHAYKLSLEHPITHTFYEWTADLPQDMANLLKQLSC